MASAQPAFGAMFRELIDLGVVEIATESLDVDIKRRLKEFWEKTSCPRCGHQSIVTWEEIDRLWCRDCNCKPGFIRETPPIVSEALGVC
jgi:ribosomal protein S27AE